MRKLIWLFLPMLLILNDCFSQSKNTKFFIDAGIVGRTVIFYTHGLNGQSSGPIYNTNFPYSYQAGVNGTGINLTIGYSLAKIGLNLMLGTTARYDFYYFDYSCNCHAKPST